MDNSTRICKTCLTEQPLDQFPTLEYGKKTRLSFKCITCDPPLPEGKKRCSTCKEIHDLKHFAFQMREHKGVYYEKRYRSSVCNFCRSRKMRQWNARVGPKRARRSLLLRTYGITPEDYEARVVAQKGACMICKRTEIGIDKRTGKPFDLAIDHDHKTGRVRDLLCSTCNNGLGCFKDDPVLLIAAADYLTLHSNIRHSYEG